MRTPTGRRIAACLAAMTAVLAFTAPAAHATVSAELSAGAVLLEQPTGSPWALDLLLGAKVIESTGQENLPITEKFTFQFPKAKVNADQFPVCKATDGDLISKGPRACPASTKIGGGTASVRAISLPFPADVTLFNGKGTKSRREIILWANATTVDVTVVLRGTLSKISNGNYGFRLELPVPEIKVLDGQFVAIEGFDVRVGKHIKKGRKKISYLEAPTKCAGAGWPFTFRADLRGGAFGSDQKTISCTIRAA